MPPQPRPDPTSAAGRQAGDYEAPVLAEPKGGPVPKFQPASPAPNHTRGLRHLPGKHNQQSHGDGGADTVAGRRQAFRPGRGAFGSNDMEAAAVVVDGPGGREVRLGIISSLTDPDGAEWDGDTARPDTTSLSRRGLRRVRNDLDEGRAAAKAAVAADPDNTELLIRGETAGIGWEMYGEDLAPYSTSISIDATGDSLTLDPKQLDRFLGWLDDLDGQMGAETQRADNNQLKQYWLHGEGAGKWATWTQLYNHLKKHMVDELAKRVAAQWFHDRYGYWPGHQKGSNPTGPG